MRHGIIAFEGMSVMSALTEADIFIFTWEAVIDGWPLKCLSLTCRSEKINTGLQIVCNYTFWKVFSAVGEVNEQIYICCSVL